MFESLCGNCNHKNCCTDSAVPLVFPTELDLIKKNHSQYANYLQTVKINGVLINAITKKNNSNECVFWDGATGRCKIYESRPIDCRLYPFDILFVNGDYYWIVYSCNEKSDWNWSEIHLKSLEDYEGFDDLMNNIDSFSEHTKMILPNESEKTPYSILRKVNWKNN
ncbi:MAG: YkgJ family cysteine cluster protein [Nitrosopumilus sp.]|nr:YkgJ family cysteine cluster protein [Nitrosopumilus sp.]